MSGPSLFIPCSEHVWLLASLSEGKLETNEGGIENPPPLEFLVDDRSNGELIQEVRVLEDVDVSELPLHNLDMSESGVEDMVNLNFLHEASILYNLKRRFETFQPYTRTGKIVIAVNPYKWLDIYGVESMSEYATRLWHELPAHVFATSAEAFRGMRDGGKPQSILVSGESGAGKTETVKIMLNMVATVASKTGPPSPFGQGSSKEVKDKIPDNGVVSKILLANPLLESFGNAKTARNDNSSRFGKFMTLQFDTFCNLDGSRCTTYLLEKSRIVVQNEEKERNYHIFYQLLSAPEEEKVELLLSGRHADGFHYTAGGDVTRGNSIEGTSDADHYLETQRILSILGIHKNLRKLLERALAAILHIGEVTFTPDQRDEGASIAENAADCCALLGIDEQAFRTQIVQRHIEVEGKTIKVGLTPEQSASSRDALAKELYARLFQWLVVVINHTTSSTSTEPNRVISLLDIFGFESFTVNRFEQLCINLANEKLQQKFCSDCFRTVQQEYQDEGLEWTKIGYKDNIDTLDMLEGRKGVLAALNEECLLGKRGSDLGFLSKAKSFCAEAGAFSAVLTKKNAFRILHYAGTVEYCVDGFTEKNRDAYPVEMLSVLARSSNALVASLFSGTAAELIADSDAASQKDHAFLKRALLLDELPQATPSATTTANAPAKRKSSFLTSETVTRKFRTQLTALMEAITQTDVQYVRCIKPNAAKSHAIYDGRMVVQQLRSAGMIEAIRISRAAYPYRVTHEDFLARFKALRPKAWHLKRAAEFEGLVSEGPSANVLNAEARAPDRVRVRAAAGALIVDILKKSPVPAPSTPKHKKGEGARKRATASKAGNVPAPALAPVAKQWELGKTKLYFSAGILEHLEALRSNLISENVCIVQTAFRGYRARAAFRRLRRAAIVTQAQCRTHLARQQYLRTLYAIVKTQSVCRVWLAKRSVSRQRVYDAAKAIQATWRARISRKAFVKVTSAVVLVQSLVLMRRQRRKYFILRDEARSQAKLQNRLDRLEEALHIEQEQSAHLQQLVLQEQESASRAATQESVLESELQLLQERIGALTAENASLRDDNSQLRAKCVDLEPSLNSALAQVEDVRPPEPPSESAAASDEALALARKEIEREREAILANAREYAASLMDQARARCDIPVSSASAQTGRTSASTSLGGTPRTKGDSLRPETLVGVPSVSTSSQMDLGQVKGEGTDVGNVSSYFPATSGTPQLGSKMPIRQTTLEDVTSIKRMLTAMEDGSGVRCAVFAVDKHSGQLVGKPVLLKKTPDRAYTGHIRIDCEVYAPWTPPSSPHNTPSQVKGGETPQSLLPPFPASLGKRATVTSAVNDDTIRPGSVKGNESTDPSVLPTSKKVKTLRFGVGDIHMIRTGSGTVTLPGGVKDNRTLVLTVQGKGELNFVMATVVACQRVHTLFSQLIAHPSATQPPSPEIRRASGDKRRVGVSGSLAPFSRKSTDIGSPLAPHSGTGGPFRSPVVNSRSGPPRTAASGIENEGRATGGNSTLPSPPALPYGTMLHTPLDKVKSKVRDSNNRATSSPGPAAGASKYRRGWLWKDEGNKRQLTRLFLTLDESSRKLTFSNVELPLDQMDTTQIKGSVDLVPGHAVVTTQTAAAFGTTVHMLEIDDNMTGEVYRFTGEKDELKPWMSALRRSLRITD